MILAHDEIISEQANGRLHILPFIAENVGANSIDVTLGNRFKKIYPNVVCGGISFIDPMLPQQFHDFTGDKSIYMIPGDLVLAETMEEAGSDFYVPMIEGRSTFARMGLKVHATAGFGDIGFKKKWTLELTCTIPIVLYPGDRIAQVYFLTPSSATWLYGREHKGHYADQEGATCAKI